MPACESSTISLTASAISGASSYVWQLPGDWSFIGDQTQQVVQAQVGSSNGNVTVRGKNEGCESDSSLSLGMTVDKLPQFLGGIAGEKYVKTNTIRRYSIVANDIVSYVWSLPSDWILLGGENTNAITVLTGTQNATLSVNAINTCGSKQTSMDVFTGVSASISEESAFRKLQVYPNPVSNELQIDYELNQKENIQLQLYGLNGQLIFTNNLMEEKAQATIQVNGLAAGLYLLKFSSNGLDITSKKIQIVR